MRKFKFPPGYFDKTASKGKTPTWLAALVVVLAIGLFVGAASLFLAVIGSVWAGITLLLQFCLEGFGVAAPFWPTFAGVALFFIVLGAITRTRQK